MYYPRFYGTISGPWRRMRHGAAVLNILDKLLVIVIAAAYFVAVMWIASLGDMRWIRAVAVPAATLAIASFLRWIINAPRPYEQFGVAPLLSADTHGKSFPSRHVTCAVIIAITLGWIKLSWGLELGAAALLVCYARLAGGLHFPRDVVAGIGLALACALVGFVLIPGA